MSHATEIYSTERDYSRWGNHIWNHASASKFQDSLQHHEQQGVHRIALEGQNTLDILVAGKPGAEGASIPVFFNGAVTTRVGKNGPFFSGGRIGPKVSPGYVCVSDPAVDRDPEVTLAWYAGYESSHSREVIVAALEAIASVYKRELVLVGGSGGGFAALYFASRLSGQASAFVWNPQTDILAYSRGFADTYLGRAFPSHFQLVDNQRDWRHQRERECITADVHNSIVDKARHTPRSIKRLLILQGVEDWHLVSHAVPYLKSHGFTPVGSGSYILDPNHCVQVAHWGEGHAPLSTELVVDHLGAFLDPRRNSLEVGRDVLLDGRCRADARLKAPMDLRPLVNTFLDKWEAVRVRDAAAVQVYTSGYPVGYGGLRFGLVQRNADSQEQLAWFTSSTRLEFAQDKLWPGASLAVVARDGLNHHLLHLDVQGSTPNPPTDLPSAGTTTLSKESLKSFNTRAFIYGSCVTRDAFSMVARSNVVEYIARSPVISAMAEPIIEMPPEIDVERIDSDFQRRMVTWDIHKSLSELLDTRSHDVVIIDLIDERLNLVDLGNDRVLTLSSEARKAGLTSNMGNLRKIDDSDYMSRWEQAALRLARMLQGETVVINRVFWASTDENGNDLTKRFPVEKNNALLTHMYQFLMDNVQNETIDYPQELLVADSNHQWGLSPFHFTPKFYTHFITRLRTILHGA